MISNGKVTAAVDPERGVFIHDGEAGRTYAVRFSAPSSVMTGLEAFNYRREIEPSPTRDEMAGLV